MIKLPSIADWIISFLLDLFKAAMLVGTGFYIGLAYGLIIGTKGVTAITNSSPKIKIIITFLLALPFVGWMYYGKNPKRYFL